MTPEINDDVRLAAIKGLLMESEVNLRKANKILEYILDNTSSDETVQEYIKDQECEEWG